MRAFDERDLLMPQIGASLPRIQREFVTQQANTGGRAFYHIVHGLIIVSITTAWQLRFRACSGQYTIQMKNCALTSTELS